MKKIIGYEETKKLLNKGLKLYHLRPAGKNVIHINNKTTAIITKKTFDKIMQEGFIKLERNDFDTFHFIEMYGVK